MYTYIYIYLHEGELKEPHRWAFQVLLPPSAGVEFAPGEFAAESEASRDRALAAILL